MGPENEKEAKEPGKERPKTPPAPPAQPLSGAESQAPPPEGITVEQEPEIEPQSIEELVEMRKIIQAKKRFTMKINDDVEIVMREITQEEIIEIDNVLVEKKIASDSPSYFNELKLHKLAYSVVAIRFKGRDLLVKNKDEVIKWLRGENEAVISILYLAYDTELSKIFAQIEKKS